jgi:acyl-CoA synthetase (NDP forming)
MYEKIATWAAATGAELYPVNPKRAEVAGLPCLRSVLDVPVDVDLAAILVGDVIPVLEEVIEKKAAFAVVFAAGFAEVGGEGEQLQRHMEALVRESGLHLLGPNTNLNAFELFRDDLRGRSIALVTQSGHQGRPVFQGQELGIRISHWAPTGNEADLEFADFAAYFAGVENVGCVAAYIEGFKDGRTLLLAADEAARNRVPIVCVKVGRTDEGRAMAKAHTGHLSGSDAVTEAAFRQFGITRVDGLDELLDTAATLARTEPPVADGVCVYSISGGTGALLADMAAAAGLKLPPLSTQTQQRLREWIPGYLRVSNPIDSGGAASADWRGRRILEAIVADPGIGMLVCPITGALPSLGDRLARDLVDVAATTDKPILVVWGSPVGDEDTYRDVLLRSNVPVFRTFRNAVTAAKAYFDWHAFRARYRSPFTPAVRRPLRAAAPARTLLGLAPVLSELESKQVLAAYGIPVTRDELVTSEKQAVRAAEAIGYPVVMKAVGRDLHHKSDAGLVRIGVSSPKKVRATFAALTERRPHAEGVLVCEQVTGGVETVVGVAHDELFGPVVMFGLGGVFVEVLGDVTFRVPPFARDEARRMVEEVRGFPLLQGARGAPKADVAALVDVIMKVQRLAVDLHADLAELDINPLLVLPRTRSGSAGNPYGAVALDALAVRREREPIVRSA